MRQDPLDFYAGGQAGYDDGDMSVGIFECWLDMGREMGLRGGTCGFGYAPGSHQDNVLMSRLGPLSRQDPTQYRELIARVGVIMLLYIHEVEREIDDLALRLRNEAGDDNIPTWFMG